MIWNNDPDMLAAFKKYWKTVTQDNFREQVLEYKKKLNLNGSCSLSCT